MLQGAVLEARSAQDRFAQLLDALPVAIYTTDAEGWVTFFNRAAAELAGREPQIGHARWCVTWRLFWSDGTPMGHDQCPMAVALKEGRPVRDVEAILQRPDGKRVHFVPYPTPLYDADGRLVGGVNMLIDITERKQAEEATRRLNETLEQRVEERTRQIAEAQSQLRASEERFRLLVQGVTDYAIFMLDPEGYVTNWNSGAARINGFTAEEIVGRHFSQFYTDQDQRDRVPFNALQVARRDGRCEMEGWRVRKDGAKFWANVVIDAIHDDAGHLIGFAKVTRDLTDKKEAEEQLRHAQKMEAIGQLTGGVAHDFNNLLTAIIGNLEMLAGLLGADDPGRRYAEGALRSASRGSRLTEQLLAFSRRQEVKPETADLNEVLRDTLMLCQKTVGEGVEIELALAEQVWPCRIDAAQFTAALLNLAGNARDAMDQSGRLVLRTENVTLGASRGPDLAAGDYVLLSVRDSGCGMTAEVLDRAFEPFFTTKDVGKGTGLGLSQVYGFATQSGGAVRLESGVDLGTTVRLYLPRARADGRCVQEPGWEEAFDKVRPGAATILVVEDDADLREMISGVVSDFGYRTFVAATGPEALAILEREDTVDLLFADIVMPAGVTGIQLAREALRLRPQLKVLLSSGYTRDEANQHPVWSEFAFIAKPYRPAMLGRKLKEVLAGGFPGGAAYG